MRLTWVISSARGIFAGGFRRTPEPASRDFIRGLMRTLWIARNAKRPDLCSAQEFLSLSLPRDFRREGALTCREIS